MIFAEIVTVLRVGDFTFSCHFGIVAKLNPAAIATLVNI